MSDRDEFGAFLVGFVVGGLTGAVVALLFAPQSGEETRALIKDKSIELRDRASQTAEEALARAEAAAAEARQRADELAKVARERANELASEVRTRGTTLANEVRERGKGAIEAVRKTTKKDGGETPTPA
ncbi:MAG TPA: YtxH domain-containing protein [Anaerolineales bacterium]|nr:YtxH domain-containing protein [Anaerolineales bacterium]